MLSTIDLDLALSYSLVHRNWYLPSNDSSGEPSLSVSAMFFLSDLNMGQGIGQVQLRFSAMIFLCARNPSKYFWKIMETMEAHDPEGVFWSREYVEVQTFHSSFCQQDIVSRFLDCLSGWCNSDIEPDFFKPEVLQTASNADGTGSLMWSVACRSSSRIGLGT